MHWYGIDLHSNNFTVAQMNEQDQTHLFKFNLNEDGIMQFRKMLHPEDKVAFKISTNGYWFYDLIKDHAGECKIINPKQFSIIYKSTSKTDRKDALLIARFLKNNLLPTVYAPEQSIRMLRSLFSSYEMLMSMKVRCKNKIYALFRQVGITISKTDIKSTLADKMQKMDIPEIIRHQVSIFLIQMENTMKQLKKIEDEIYLSGEKYKEMIEILISEPGISVITALSVIADVADISRFPNAKKLTSYLGCAPWVNSSNDKTYIGRTHKDCRKYTKTRMIQSINHFCRHSAEINEFYNSKCLGKKKGVVRMAIVRKKIVGLYYMLKRHQYSRNRDIELHTKKLSEYETKLGNLKNEGHYQKTA